MDRRHARSFDLVRAQKEVVVPVVIVALIAMGATTLVMWRIRRRRPGSRRGSALFVGGALLLVVGSFGAGVYVWALNSTDSSQVARSIVWGGSSFGDQDRFPARSMSASAEPVTFAEAADSPVAEYAEPGSGTPLEEILTSSDTTAFIVIHGDELLYEEYFNGSSREDVQTSFSVAKSFTATLIGIAIDEGFIDSLADAVTEHIPELRERDTRFDDITLGHLITMSSGLSFDDGASPWADPANTYYGTDLRTAAVTKPSVQDPPGVVFDYNDWNVVLLGLVLERATDMPVAQYMQTRLWQPMGAEAGGSWSLDSDRHGFEKMFVGVNGRAIDSAKLGWLYLHEGRNGNLQVVPSDFVAESTRVDTTTDPAADYQYLWWIDVARDSYFAHGDHGQFIYVDPSAELVVVRHGRSGDLDWVEFIGNLNEWLEDVV